MATILCLGNLLAVCCIACSCESLILAAILGAVFIGSAIFWGVKGGLFNER